jgi:hypothetical protein
VSVVEVNDYLSGDLLDVRDLARDTRPHRVKAGIVHWTHATTTSLTPSSW